MVLLVPLQRVFYSGSKMAEKQKNVYVLVDAKHPGKGVRYRPSHWVQAIGSRAQVKEVSIAENVKNNTVVSIENTDVLILNWDVANGQAICGADITLDFFRSAGKVRVTELMRNGGTLLVEFQTSKGVPVQDSYDAIFGLGQLEVLSEVLDDDARRGTRATPFRRFVKHPLVPAESVLSAQPQDTNETLFFLKFTGEEEKQRRPLYERFQDSLWFGWFTWWGRGWFPLLCAELSSKHPQKYKRFPCPVLLAKTVDKGLTLASTMVIARANCTALIERILQANLDAIRRYHRNYLLLRRVVDMLYLLLILCVLTLLTWALFKLYTEEKTKDFRLILSVLSVGDVWAATLSLHGYKKFVWDRPMGFSVFQAVKAHFYISKDRGRRGFRS